MKALIIDDEPGIRLALGHFIRGRGYEVLEASSGSAGLALARTELPDVVFLDRRLPDGDGESLLQPLTSPEIGASVVIMTAYVELDKAVQAMKNGAEYYFAKPLDMEHIAVILERLEDKLKLRNELCHFRRISELDGEGIIVGESPPIIKIQRLVSLLAKNVTTPVLILGESGSGKEMVAKAIHRQSGCTGPMVEINCASLSENLLESELFGHEKGAFTDAKKSKPGLLEVAGTGTVFLDEIAEMPLSIQAKLLKVLDSRTFRRVGGITDIRTNTRFMAATNKDIAALVRNGFFRGDLYYRLNVLPITVPPLRERGRDIILLADFFVRGMGERMGKVSVGISPQVMEHLQHYQWPGNVRELKNVIERMLILTTRGEILPEHLPSEIRQDVSFSKVSHDTRNIRPLWQIEEEYIAHVLKLNEYNHSRTAAYLGISRSTLLARLKKMKASVAK
jgi:DNA-binding NtrC family response regulator